MSKLIRVFFLLLLFLSLRSIGHKIKTLRTYTFTC